MRGIAAALVMALALTLGDIVVLADPGSAALAKPKPTSKAECPNERADQTSAQVTARLCKKRIQVSGLTSETDQVWVNPDGSVSVQHNQRPVRVRQGDKWVGADATLRFAGDGSVVPKAAALDLAFSGGGSAPLVTSGAGGTALELGWSAGTLPKPTLSGRIATYADVMPGVDLQVVADVDGFSEQLVVKTREAAGNPGLNTLRFPARTTGGALKVGSDGAMIVSDVRGRPVFAASAAEMWDATEAAAMDGDGRRAGEARSDAASGAREVRHGKRATMGVRHAGGVLEITPSQAVLADPATVYPVTIDPGFTSSRTSWNYIDYGYPGSSYANKADYATVGTYDSGTHRRRSFFNMDLSGIGSGKQIVSATFRIKEVWAWSCTAKAVQLYRSPAVASNVTWNTRPSDASLSLIGTQSVAKGYSSAGIGGSSSCPAGDVTWDVRGAVQDVENAGGTSITLMLKAGTETDNFYWKKFDSNPRIDITYNSYPSAPGMSTSPATACGSAAQNPIASATPTLRASVYDPDGGQLATTFEWWVSGGSAQVGSATVSAPSGTVASASVPSGAFREGGAYAWRVKSNDGLVDSPWAGWCEFTIDTTKPGVPTISSTLYPSTSQTNTWGHGGYGQAGQFTFTPAAATTDVVAWIYQMDTDAAPSTVNASGATTVSITPSEDGRRTLSVRARDKAGNTSDANTYVFNVGRAGLRMPQPGANVVIRMKLAVDGDATYTRVKYQYRRGPGGAEYDVPVSNLRRADGSAAPAYPIPLAELGANAIWDAVDTLGTVGGVVQVRAVLYSATDATNGYNTQWITVNVDPDGDGAASTGVGPGSVNLLTGDYSLSSTDADEFGLSVDRAASSRETSDGWLRQGERLNAAQQQVTDVSGFAASQGGIARSTIRGQGSSTDSLVIVPNATGPTGDPDVFGYFGGSETTLTFGMKPGHRYRMTGWIYVPAATGLDPAFARRGLRIVGFYKSSGQYHEVSSVKAGWVDAWQELTVDLQLPADATEAFFRLYNGNAYGSNKQVFFDNLSLSEVVAPFGPQWSGGAGGGMADVDYTTLTFPAADLAEVGLVGGDYLTFARNSAGQFFPEPGAEDLTLTQVNATTYRLAELDGTISEFTKQGTAFTVTGTWTADANSTTRYLYDTTDSRSLVKRVINAVEPGVGDCTTATPARGCEVLEYDYATATTATGSAFGDYTDRVRAVKVWSWDPAANSGAGAETAVEVARYAYDDQGRLREVWDPRLDPPLKTTYEYDDIGHVTKLTPAGQLPWMIDHGTVSGDGNTGRLLRVRRNTLKPGSKDQLDGEIATNVVYRVPLTHNAGGPYDLDALAIATWGQKDLPTDATAVFGPESTPDANVASSSSPGSGGYALANVFYLNASAQQVNAAAPGGHIDSQEYDEYGNVVWALEATNRELALGTLPDAAARAVDLNLPADSVQRANLLASVSTYSPDGFDLVDALGPVSKVALERDLADPAGAKPTLVAGTQVVARGHSTYAYDEGKPDGARYHLVTAERSGATVVGYPDADVRVVRTGYGAEKGGISGWTLRMATSSTTDAGTAYTVYDAAGRPQKSWGIGSNGADARATISVYYAAGANSADAACGNKPEWAGQPCVTMAGGAVTGHDPARMTTDLPVRRVESYTRYGDTQAVSETVAGKTRRTVTGYDGADRVKLVQIMSDEGTALPPATTEHDPDTGLVTTTTSGSTVISREYDLLGRVIKYTDADGGVTRSEFDRYGKPSKVSDNTGSSTFTYDRSIEPRGFLTSVIDSIAGTFNARYSPDGQLIELKYPGGLTRTDTLDANFSPVTRVYKRDSDGQTIYAESIIANSQAQWINHSYTGGSKTYGHDNLGRLTSVQESTTLGCTTRVYAYDTRANRTAKRQYNPDTGGACRGDGAADAEDGHSYDTADRITDAGYTYDAFGRTTALPNGLTNTYYANDLVAGQQLGDTRQSWTLDSAHRFRGYTTEKQVNGSWANASSKLNHYGDDSDEPRWIIEDTSLGSLTRNVSGPDSDLVATTSATGDVRLQLNSLHGDVAATVDTGITSPELYSYDEFGVPVDSQSDRRYGWLGGKQRSGDALGDVILMGIRLYSPSLGRFLQVDPVDGGNATAYDYCSGDPVNCTDLNGQWGWGSLKKALKIVAEVASVASMIPGPVGTVCGVVSAVAYVATGNWKEAAWAVGGALAATVGAAAVVKGAKAAVTAVKASRRVGKLTSLASKATRAVARVCNSFSPDTPVLMGDGSHLPISDIQPGDFVVAVDPDTGEASAQPVLDVFVGQGTRHLIDIDLGDDDGGVLTATANHPILVAGRGWVDAAKVRPGDLLVTPTGETVAVVSVTDRGMVEHQTVYNLNVGTVHTFLVSADGYDVLVHNNSNACKKAVLLGKKADIERYIDTHKGGFTADFLNIKGKMAGGKKGIGGWNWTRNKRFMNEALESGQEVRLVTNPNVPLYRWGNTYQRELKYLKKKGYGWTPKGDHWLVVRVR